MFKSIACLGRAMILLPSCKPRWSVQVRWCWSLIEQHGSLPYNKLVTVHAIAACVFGQNADSKFAKAIWSWCFHNRRPFQVICGHVLANQKSVAVSFWSSTQPFNELLLVCRSPTKRGWQGQMHGICIMALVDGLQASSVLVFYHFLVACLCTVARAQSGINGRWTWSIKSIVFMTWKSGRSIRRIKLYLEEPSISGRSVPLRLRNLYTSTCISDLASLCRLIASQKRGQPQVCENLCLWRPPDLTKENRTSWKAWECWRFLSFRDLHSFIWQTLVGAQMASQHILEDQA